MINCVDITRYFIKRTYEDDLENQVTNLTMQRFLYYAQSLHLALFDKPLFDEEIQAWRYGPVCPVAYAFYSEFESKQLPIFCIKDFLSQLSSEVKNFLQKLWICYRNCLLDPKDGCFIVCVDCRDTTRLSSAWQDCRKGLLWITGSTAVISQAAIKRDGQRTLDLLIWDTIELNYDGSDEPSDYYDE